MPLLSLAGSQKPFGGSCFYRKSVESQGEGNQGAIHLREAHLAASFYGVCQPQLEAVRCPIAWLVLESFRRKA